MQRNRLALIFSIVALAINSLGYCDRASVKLPPTNLKPDEDILFFPTYGHFDPEVDVWRFDVHGKVFEPENSSAKRAAFIALLRAATNANRDLKDAVFLDDRVRPFLVDNERGKSVTIEVAGEQFLAGISQPNGHFSKTLTLSPDSPASAVRKNQILEIQAILCDDDPREFTGRVHLIAPTGVSVISDIDDTIKLSQVTDKSELMKNTFLRPFRAVEGMPELYKRLADLEVAFHYVSGSPWQLYQPIESFMTESGFTQGTLDLKYFRLKDRSVVDLLSSQTATKLAAITPLLGAFPERQFILIGDSGEQDPEIYGQIARAFPDQVMGIFIRNVTSQVSADERFSKAFQDVPGDRWALFDDASEVSDQIFSAAKFQN